MTTPQRLRDVADRLPEFDALRDSARDIKNHTQSFLDLYLDAFEERATARGSHVHYAVTAEEANRSTSAASMRPRPSPRASRWSARKIGLNDFLEANGVTPIETDLGEYIIQTRHEMPSHIIMPAVHLRKAQIEADFRRVPIYHAVGGHAYGWVYPGPMGAVLTPSLIGVDKAGHLPNAPTFCGRCEEVCPVRIPLPRLMRFWRERDHVIIVG